MRLMENVPSPGNPPEHAAPQGHKLEVLGADGQEKQRTLGGRAGRTPPALPSCTNRTAGHTVPSPAAETHPGPHRLAAGLTDRALAEVSLNQLDARIRFHSPMGSALGLKSEASGWAWATGRASGEPQAETGGCASPRPAGWLTLAPGERAPHRSSGRPGGTPKQAVGPQHNHCTPPQSPTVTTHETHCFLTSLGLTVPSVMD